MRWVADVARRLLAGGPLLLLRLLLLLRRRARLAQATEDAAAQPHPAPEAARMLVVEPGNLHTLNAHSHLTALAESSSGLTSWRSFGWGQAKSAWLIKKKMKAYLI